MGVMIFVLTLIHAVALDGLLRARWAGRSRLAACRWGAGITLLGLAIGGLMVRPECRADWPRRALAVLPPRARMRWASPTAAPACPS